MAQRFHTFRGDSLDAAYQAMRNRLGDGATVVRTNTIQEGGVLGFFGRKRVEITAAVAVRDATRKRTVAERQYQAASSVLPLHEAKRPAVSAALENRTPTIGSDKQVNETVAFFRELVNQRQAANSPSPRASAGTHGTQRPTAIPSATSPRALAEGNTAVSPILPFEAPARAERADESDAEKKALRQDLKDMRDMLNVLVAETPGAGLPEAFAPHYRKLLERGVPRETAAQLVSRAADCDQPELLYDAKAFRERLKLEIRRGVTVTGGTRLTGGKRMVVAVVGPTGVGKTTNLAKLAALYSVRERARVGLVTSDTYRVAATEQLRVYANIIGLDLEVVHDAKETAAALKGFADHDLVLVDTAGGSPFNRKQIAETASILDAAAPDEVLLSLGATTPFEDMREVAERFAALKPTSLFFTKLDETRRYGPIFALAQDSGLPISYLSIGQNVPDDVVLAHPGLVADLVMEGGDRRGKTSSESS